MQFHMEFNVDHLCRALTAARRELEQPHDLLNTIGLDLKQENEHRHEADKDPDGKAWAPLSSRTLARKRSKKMLNEHGEMLRNGFIHQVVGDTVRIGTPDWKGPFFQFGVKPHAQRRGTHPGMPARRIVGFPESDQQRTFDVVKNHLDVILERARGRS
jgi:phage virion morphogenesis protein